MSTGTKQLANLGVGVAIHFRMLRYLFWFFTAATLITVPVFAFAHAGTRLKDVQQLDALGLAPISLANIGSTTAFSNYTSTPWSAVGDHKEYPMRWISAIVSACSFAVVWLFLLFTAWANNRIRDIAAEVDANNTTASDYAVFVRGLPRDVTEDEVREHFSKLYNLRSDDWVYNSSCRSCCWYGRKTARNQRRKFNVPIRPPKNKDGGKGGAEGSDRPSKPAPQLQGGAGASVGGKVIRELRDEDVFPVLDARNSGNAAYLRSWVAEVSLATANGTLIKRYQALKGLLDRIRHARAVVKKFNTGSRFHDEKKKGKALKRLAAVERSLDKIDKKYSAQYKEQIVGAYVIFNNAESLARCIEDYENSSSWLSPASWFQPQPLRFHRQLPAADLEASQQPVDAGNDAPPAKPGSTSASKPPKTSWRLEVRRAPDPSSIIWENLQLTTCDRILRQTLVNGLLGLLLFISFVLIILAQAQQGTYKNSIPRLDLCETALPAMAFNYTVTPKGGIAPPNGLPINAHLVRDTHDPAVGYHSECPKSEFGVYWVSDSPTAVPITSYNNSNPCLSTCVRPTTTDQCSVPTTTGGLLSFPLSTLVGCYCADTLKSEIATSGFMSGLKSFMATEMDLCSSLAYAYVLNQVLQVVVAIAVVFINTMLRSVLQVISELEGSPSVGDQQRASANKVFLALFLNTAILALLVNAALPAPIANLRVNGTQVFQGTYSGFNVGWILSVGSGIVLTMLINALSPHVYVAYLLCLLRCRRLTTDSNAVTQGELNKDYTPPEFEMPTRTAVVLNAVFVCLMYAPGMPILLPVAAISMGVFYLMDKIAILRLYQRPPAYDEAMAKFILGWLPYAAICHLLVAIWMYSEPSLLWSPRVFGDASQDGSNNASVDALSSLMSNAENGDKSGLNIVARLSRENTWPLFVLLVVFAGGMLLYNTAGKALAALFCQCCGHKRHVITATNPPYTGRYIVCRWAVEPGECASLHSVGKCSPMVVIVANGTFLLVDSPLMPQALTPSCSTQASAID